MTNYISAVNRAIPDVFAAIDSTPKCLRLKMLLPQKVKLAGSLDIRHITSEGSCLTHYISAGDRALPDIFAAIDRSPKFLQGDRKSSV